MALKIRIMGPYDEVMRARSAFTMKGEKVWQGPYPEMTGEGVVLYCTVDPDPPHLRRSNMTEDKRKDGEGMTYKTCGCEGFRYMVDRGAFKVAEIVNTKTWEHIRYAPKMKLGGRWFEFRWCPFCGKDLEDKEAEE